jgi:ribose-phosphate pyrophosphokinase
MGVNHVVTLEAHNLAAFQNAWRVSSDHLDPRKLFVDYFVPLIHQNEVVVVSPDAGGAKRAEAFRQALGRTLNRSVHTAFVEKYRSEDVVTGSLIIGDVNGKLALILDDLISTGNTLVRAAEACRAQGAKAVYAAASHGAFSGKANEVLSQPALERIVITNSIPPWRLDPSLIQKKVTVLDAAPLFAEAIKRIHHGGSIASLLEP